MSAADPPILPYVFGVLALFIVYRRFRRNFGPQRLQPVRMALRIAFLSFVAVALLPAAARSWALLAAALAGLVVGAGIGVFGARRTRYQRDSTQIYYIPHTYTGVAVSTLLIARLVYRAAELYGRGHLQADSSPPESWASPQFMQSPLTLALFGVVVAYYVVYYGWILRKSRHLGPEDLEPVTSP